MSPDVVVGPVAPRSVQRTHLKDRGRWSGTDAEVQTPVGRHII